MGALCTGTSNPRIFVEPALDDWMNSSESEENPARLYAPYPQDDMIFQSAPNGRLSPVIRLRTRSKSAVLPNRRQRGAVSLKQQIRERIQERKRTTIVGAGFIQDEYGARQYCDAVMQNTWMELQNTCNFAESIERKGADMCEELARQERVICKADNCVYSTEQDLNETRYRLRGMKSLRGKVANFLWHKRPEAKSYSDIVIETREFRTSSTSLCPYVPYSSPQKATQYQIKAGVDRLSATLDEVKRQQLVIADELQHQDKKLSEFDTNMGRVHGKVHCQTDLIRCISS